MPGDATKGKGGDIPLQIITQYLKQAQADVNNYH